MTQTITSSPTTPVVKIQMLLCFLIVTVLIVAGAFTRGPCKMRAGPRTAGSSRVSLWMTASLAPALGGDENDPISAPTFDLDFAEAISKPLPEWYKEQKRKEEVVLREIEENRERIMREFRAKYEVSEEEKQRERFTKMQRLADAEKKRKLKAAAAGMGGGSLFSKMLGGLSGSSRSTGVKDTETEEGEGEEETQEDESATRENWKRFWEQEEKETGFYLPGFFEVFPELELKWPQWSKNKNGDITKCEVDADCPFPQACCPHPIIPGDKFCCTGWGRRVMVPKYQGQEAYSVRVKSGPPESEKPKKEGWQWD